MQKWLEREIADAGLERVEVSFEPGQEKADVLGEMELWRQGGLGLRDYEID